MDPPSSPAFEFLQALRSARNRQATMWAQSVGAVAPFRFLDLPREVRDDIYEAAIFDLSPPDMFMRPQDPDSIRLRKMDTNVLLTSRQVYWESRDVIVRRAHLVMVSIEHRNIDLLEKLLIPLSGITGIDPMYHNFCVMTHRIDTSRTPSTLRHPPSEPREKWEFILHRHDAEYFCRVIMGEFDDGHGADFGTEATHTLSLHCSSTYGQHEFSNVYATQTLVLQKYRNILRNFEHTFICGPSLGWENGMYGAVLQDIRSIDDRQPTDLIDDIRALEQKGSQILLQTGDVEAADVPWSKAFCKCLIGLLSFDLSDPPDLLGTYVPNNFKTHVNRWIRLRHQHGDECAVTFIELWYKLTRQRLSGALRFFEQGHHLTTRHGRSPRHRDHYLDFATMCCAELQLILSFLEVDPWSPPPADEAQFCLTAAAIFRILDATDEVQGAYGAILRASELAPDDEPIQQERVRVETWIRRLVDNGTLEHFPSSESLTEPWWSTFCEDLSAL